jgi:hypothetical protein
LLKTRFLALSLGLKNQTICWNMFGLKLNSFMLKLLSLSAFPIYSHRGYRWAIIVLVRHYLKICWFSPEIQQLSINKALSIKAVMLRSNFNSQFIRG